MRIAVSGTHATGKSTLIAAFVRRNRQYAVEPEAYEALSDLFGEGFAADPCAEDFFRQLEYQVGRLGVYAAGNKVVFERSPADYVAYLRALETLGRPTADAVLTERAIEMARDVMERLDLILYLPASGRGPESEDPELGSAVDAWLEAILLNGDLALIGEGSPVVVEAAGPVANRLRILENALSLEERLGDTSFSGSEPS
jgi:AAA domain